MTVAYAESSESVKVIPIRAWKRSDVDDSLLDESTFRGMVARIFQARAEISGVLMVLRLGVPFCLYFVQGHWFDCTGKQVTIDASIPETSSTLAL